ncbi:MAG: FliM/FliN family flagellar motor switch protein [Candidatus Hinthialibacter antarcticus]|nr:FliM/FliN family flagellar motor switch protein [Candidatus Hinthialibacter antarcticus]
MSDLLSQEEIDMLLNAGLGDDSSDDFSEPAPAAPAPTPSPSQNFSSFDQMQYGAESGQDAPSKTRPSAKLDKSKSVNIQKAVFMPFDEEEPAMETTNLDVILNLDLDIRVELGKTHSSVQDILEMGSGSVLELNKLNGEPCDLMVNSKSFAKGEMIVIGENFGVRVTDILTVTEIIEAL